MHLYNEHLGKAVIAAKKAGEMLRNIIPSDHCLNSEERLRLMEDADRRVHNCIYDTLCEGFIEYEYISVYTENQIFYKDKPLWVIDPIVGLGNFSHGDPHFAVSIALMINGVTVVALIYNPIFNELFTAIKSKGAFLNEKRIKVSKTKKLQHALLSTRFPYDIRDNKVTNLSLFNHLIMKAEGILNNGSATLDLAYVASGQYDGFWALHMNPWDLTAAVLLIEEAGGEITTLSGETYMTESLEVLATNGIIHKEIIKAISKVPKE